MRREDVRKFLKPEKRVWFDELNDIEAISTVGKYMLGYGYGILRTKWLASPLYMTFDIVQGDIVAEGYGLLVQAGIVGYWQKFAERLTRKTKLKEYAGVSGILLSFYKILEQFQFQHTFHEKTKEHVEFIEAKTENGESVLEMHSMFTKLTLDVLCGKLCRYRIDLLVIFCACFLKKCNVILVVTAETAMGKKLYCLRDPNNPFLKATLRYG